MPPGSPKRTLRKKSKTDPAKSPIWRKTRRSKAKSPSPAEGVMLVGQSLRGTGFQQEANPQDAQFPLSAVLGEVVGDPRTQTQVWHLPAHLLNQGSTNSCVGHACAHFILAAPIMSVSADPIVIWRRAQELDEFPGNEGTNTGTSVRAGFKAMQEHDLVKGDYRWGKNADEVLRFVLTRGPIVVGTPWYPGMGSPKSGVMRVSGPQPSEAHAYLLFGFDPNHDAFLVANSWGTSWGINGMGFLPFDALNRLLNEGGVACSALQED